MTDEHYHFTMPVKGPKGKIVTAYAVMSPEGLEVARYRIRIEGRGYWRNAYNLAHDHASRLSNENGGA